MHRKPRKSEVRDRKSENMLSGRRLKCNTFCRIPGPLGFRDTVPAQFTEQARLHHNRPGLMLSFIGDNLPDDGIDSVTYAGKGEDDSRM
jgi:hypothetical protein